MSLLLSVCVEEIAQVTPHFIACGHLKGVGVARCHEPLPQVELLPCNGVNLAVTPVSLALPVCTLPLYTLNKICPLFQEYVCRRSECHRIHRAKELAVTAALESLEEQHDLRHFEVKQQLVESRCALNTLLHVHLFVRSGIFVDVVDIAHEERRACVPVSEHRIDIHQCRTLCDHTFLCRQTELR